MIQTQIVKCRTGSDDVCDGIQSSDFMKMDLVQCLAVNFGFHFSDTTENGHGPLFDPRINRCFIDQFTDLGVRTSMMPVGMLFLVVGMIVRLIVGMIMVVRGVAVSVDIDFDSINRAPHLMLFVKMNLFGEVQGINDGLDLCGWNSQVNERTQKHIAADAGKTIEVKSLGHEEITKA